MRILISTILIFVFCSINLIAQKNEITDKLRESRIDSLLDVIVFDEQAKSPSTVLKTRYQFLYVRTSYSSNTYFAGREIGENQYNQSGQVFYLNSNGIYAGVAGTWYSQLDPGYRTTVLSLGYGKSLKNMKFLRYRFSSDYFLYHNDNPDFEPLYSGAINAGLTLKSKNLGTRGGVSFLIGKEFGTQATWNVYSYINLVKLGKYDKIRLGPEASLYFGSESVEYQLNEVLIDTLTNTSYTSYYKNEFGLLNIQIELPLSINYKSFDLEAAWIYNFPQTMNKGKSYPENWFFRISLGYIFKL
ncbi:MAG: hypothetical protein WAO52_07815 [Prolixibacteraceae bacterium]